MSTQDQAPQWAQEADELAFQICRYQYGYYNGGSAGSGDAIAYYDGVGQHLPGNESQRRIVASMIRDWLAKHAPATPPPILLRKYRLLWETAGLVINAELTREECRKLAERAVQECIDMGDDSEEHAPTVPPTADGGALRERIAVALIDYASKRYCVQLAHSAALAQADAVLAALAATSMEPCHECGGAGGVDSGGVTPWGAAIDIPCPSCVTPADPTNACIVSKEGLDAMTETVAERLREAATKLIENNGGPLHSEEAEERGAPEDYVMIRLPDFEALSAALAERKGTT